jgi:diadenosine tetraphosphatase ApaH/serine/threonine PP2A family protein phosphatase
MRYAVLSDIHGNLEALRAVLADCRGRIDGLLCLGDLVGYGADPAACIELIAERAQLLVAGNHEYGVTGQLSPAWFNPYARAALEWTAATLGDDHRAWLRGLSLTARLGDATLVHASPRRPAAWEYILTAADGFAALDAFDTRLAFVGHSHQPGYWSLGADERARTAGAVEIGLKRGHRYIVNVGSVGQPRDRDPRATYAIWDRTARRISIRRVPYDITEARRKIVTAGLPRFLADRLQSGT